MEDQILGRLCKAMSVCPVHKRYVLADIQTMLIPAVRLKQIAFFEGDEHFGALTWAFLNENAAEKHVKNEIPLEFNEWTSGEQVWIMSLIGVGIKPRKLMPKLTETLRFQKCFYLRRDSNMHVKKVVTLTRSEGGISPKSFWLN